MSADIIKSLYDQIAALLKRIQRLEAVETPAAGIGTPHNILSATHPDTNLAAPSDQDILTYDLGTGKWLAAAAPGGNDPDAIHDNVAGEIAAIANKAAPGIGDMLVIEDAAAVNAKKMIYIGDLPTGADPDAIHDNVAGEIHAIDNKATPVDADELIIEDSADSWAKKRVAVSSLPAGAGGSVATDAIWDTAGDLVQADGANSAVKLPIGAANQLLRVNAGATAAEWASVGRVLIAEALPDGVTSVSFTSIPATFKSLYIEWMGRSSKAAVVSEGLYVYFNNDTTAANYRRQKGLFIGTGTGIITADDSYVGDLPAANATAGMITSAFARIIQYAGTTFHKQIIVNHASRNAATTNEIGMLSVQWENTAAINRVDFVLANNFVDGTVFRLYGEY